LIRRGGINLVSHSAILLRYLADAERLTGAGAGRLSTRA
jgi:hypothetical protein